MDRNERPVPVLIFSDYATLKRGGQRSTWFILRDIDRKLYRPVLACPDKGELTDKCAAAGIPVETLLALPLRPWRLLELIDSLRRLAGIIDKHRIRIVHSEELRIVAIAALLKLTRSIKVVWHVRILFRKPLQKTAAHFLADRIICVSEAVRRSFPIKRKTLVVHNGVDTDEFDPAKRTDTVARIDKDAAIIGYIGSLVGHKGVDVLIRSLPDLLTAHPAARLLLVGSGKPEYERYLKMLSDDLRVRDSVIFWGEETDTLPLLSRINVFALPSFSEGLSRSALEAMAMEKPVVLSDIPQNAELVSHGTTGLLAKAGDPLDFSRKCIEFLNDPKAAALMGKNARLRVTRNFSLRSTISGVESVFNDLIARQEAAHS